MSEKKRVLIVYERFNTGGSTTALLNLLNSFDYERFNVELISYRNENEACRALIPKQVKILNDAAKLGESRFSRVFKAASLLASPSFYKAMRIYKKRKKKYSKYQVLQHMAYARLRLSKKVYDNYDVVMGYVEGWSDAYALSKLVNADKRIIFIHLDYLASGLLPNIDRAAFARADKIICVSKACKNCFITAFPELADKAEYCENMFLPQRLNELALSYKTEECELPRFITVCRADIYVKGLDRILNIAANLKKNGYKFRWELIGVDTEGAFGEAFKEYKLSDCVFPLGNMENPYPYFVSADWLIVASRFEAKPMVVTEAELLGLPCIATEYSSVREQISDGIDGLIAENSENGLYEVICRALDDTSLKESCKRNLEQRQAKLKAGFKSTLEKLYNILEE